VSSHRQKSLDVMVYRLTIGRTSSSPIPKLCRKPVRKRRLAMHGIIYLVGLIVVIMAILTLFGLR
jgi:hypothetical protein